MTAKIKARLFGIPKLIEVMGDNGEGEFEFSGETVDTFFSWLLQKYGFRRQDFPLLEDWETNPSVTIILNGEILNKEDYGKRTLRDGDQVSLLLYTGCC
jgi:hypothetical protein